MSKVDDVENNAEAKELGLMSSNRRVSAHGILSAYDVAFLVVECARTRNVSQNVKVYVRFVGWHDSSSFPLQSNARQGHEEDRCA